MQRAYQSCEQAVQDQIARLTSDDHTDASQPHNRSQEVVEVRTSLTISGVKVTRIPAETNGAETRATNNAVFRDAPSPRPATASQVKAIQG